MLGHDDLIVTCQSIQSLPECKGLSLIAGHSGLHHPIRWVHHIEEPSYVRFIDGGELILTGGMLLQDKDISLKVIAELHRRGAAGIVINEAYQFPHISDIIALGNQLDLCIFSLPFRYRFIDITQSICHKIFACEQLKHERENLLLSLLLGKLNHSSELETLLAEHGIKQNQPYGCFVLRLMTSRKEPSRLQPLLPRINKIMAAYRIRNQLPILHLQYGCELLCLCEVTKAASAEQLLPFCQMLSNDFSQEFPDFHSYIGLGDIAVDFDSLRHNMEAARRMASLASRMEQQILFIKHSEIFEIFQEIQQPKFLKDIYQSVLHPLAVHDTTHKGSLVQTLQTYLQCNCHLQQTADRLFIHYNTLRYRLRTIEQLLNIDLKSYKDVSRLMLTMQLGDYLDCLESV